MQSSIDDEVGQLFIFAYTVYVIWSVVKADAIIYRPVVEYTLGIPIVYNSSTSYITEVQTMKVRNRAEPFYLHA